MDNVSISVVVACYNPQFNKLQNTIRSIVKQKDVSFEIVIGDDGSKIDYQKELESWIEEQKYSNIKLNFLPQNVGTVKNILSALYLCEGKYVKTISPGDYLYDEYTLKNYVDAFENLKADLVFGRAQYFSPDGKLLDGSAPQNNAVYKNRFVKKSVLDCNDYILGAAIASKTDVEIYYLEQIKDKIKYLEDIPLTLFSLIDGKKICAVDKKVVWYEYGEGISTDQSRSPLLEADYKAVEAELLKKNKKIAKRYIKFTNAGNEKNSVKRFVKKVTASPFYLIYKLTSTFSKKAQEKDDAIKMHEIIK